MHKIQDVLVHKDLQTCGKFFVRFPEAQTDGKKGKQIQFIGNIASFDLFSM